MQLVNRCRTACQTLRSLLADPPAQTYFPEAARKSKAAVWLDHARWFAKYRNLNHYYYVYGFDRKEGYRLSDYLDEKTFCRLRNHYNRSFMLGGRKANYICLMDDKFLFGMYLQALGFPAPRILAICDRDKLTWLDRQQTVAFETVAAHVGMDVFVKDLIGECGQGVFSLKIRPDTFLVNGRPQTLEQLRGRIKGKCLIQERVVQHPEMNRLNPHSVNCLRIITARKGEDIVPLSVLLKVGSSKSPCDNWAAGGVIVGVDIETGELSKYGFYKMGYGKKVSEQPETRVRFEDFKIPHLTDCIDTVCRLHQYFYGLHSIGWDIAVGPDGPMILEGNDRWDTQMQQVQDTRIKQKFLATLPAGEGGRV